MIRARMVAIGTLVLLFALVASSVAQSTADLYKSKTCAACHGPDGKGDTPMGKKLGARDFHSPDVQKMSDEELFNVTKSGKNKMPAYKDKLSDQQIKDLVQYVRELGKQ